MSALSVYDGTHLPVRTFASPRPFVPHLFLPLASIANIGTLLVHRFVLAVPTANWSTNRSRISQTLTNILSVSEPIIDLFLSPLPYLWPIVGKNVSCVAASATKVKYTHTLYSHVDSY